VAYETEPDNDPDADRYHALENREKFLVPAVNLNGRIYSQYDGCAIDILDETYILMGVVASYTPYLFNSTKDLQASHPHIIGARIFHAGDNLIAVSLEGSHSIYRYNGDRVIGWQAIEDMPQHLLEEDENGFTAEWMPQPLIHVNGRLYGIHARIAPTGRYYDESYVFVGVVSSHRWFIGHDPVNLLTNDPVFVGASIYQSDDRLVVVREDGEHFSTRFSGHMSENWRIFE